MIRIFSQVARDKFIQSKLRQEIKDNLLEDGFLDFDVLNNMEYLDNVVNEGLRIYTTVPRRIKICTKTYELKGSNGKSVLLKPKDTILIPVHSLHNDSEYYTNPELFRPDRFSEANGGTKKFKDDCLYMPFGIGPRICTGNYVLCDVMYFTNDSY